MASVPTDGDMDQFTLVLLDPVTVALNVADPPPLREVLAGDTETATGTSDNFALALFVELAALIAVTVKVWADAIVAGAV